MPPSASPDPHRDPRPAGDDPPLDDAPASPVGDAFAWASRILAIGLAMFLPGVGGNWLDLRLGTRFLGPVGLILGFTAALVWLVQIGNSVKPYHPRKKQRFQLPPAAGQEEERNDA